jgi:hypothetical protein
MQKFNLVALIAFVSVIAAIPVTNANLEERLDGCYCHVAGCQDGLGNLNIALN